MTHPTHAALDQLNESLREIEEAFRTRYAGQACGQVPLHEHVLTFLVFDGTSLYIENVQPHTVQLVPICSASKERRLEVSNNLDILRRVLDTQVWLHTRTGAP